MVWDGWCVCTSSNMCVRVQGGLLSLLLLVWTLLEVHCKGYITGTYFRKNTYTPSRQGRHNKRG